MTALDPQALAQAADDAAVDELMRRRNHIEPVEDRSGLLGVPSGTPPAEASEDEQFDAYFARSFPGAVVPTAEPEPVAAAPASQPAVPTMPEIHQGARGGAPSDDAAFEAYMARFFQRASPA